MFVENVPLILHNASSSPLLTWATGGFFSLLTLRPSVPPGSSAHHIVVTRFRLCIQEFVSLMRIYSQPPAICPNNHFNCSYQVRGSWLCTSGFAYLSRSGWKFCLTTSVFCWVQEKSFTVCPAFPSFNDEGGAFQALYMWYGKQNIIMYLFMDRKF